MPEVTLSDSVVRRYHVYVVAIRSSSFVPDPDSVRATIGKTQNSIP